MMKKRDNDNIGPGCWKHRHQASPSKHIPKGSELKKPTPQVWASE